jgi:hypothetical protein
MHALILLELCSRDVMVVRMTYTREQSTRKLTVTSAYLPYDSEKPPQTELGTSSTTVAQKQNAAHR